MKARLRFLCDPLTRVSARGGNTVCHAVHAKRAQPDLQTRASAKTSRILGGDDGAGERRSLRYHDAVRPTTIGVVERGGENLAPGARNLVSNVCPSRTRMRVPAGIGSPDSACSAAGSFGGLVTKGGIDAAAWVQDRPGTAETTGELRHAGVVYTAGSAAGCSAPPDQAMCSDGCTPSRTIAAASQSGISVTSTYLHVLCLLTRGAYWRRARPAARAR